MSGKGSDQRPTDHKKFSNNYDLIFRKKNEQVQNNPSTERPVALPTTEGKKSETS